jgi:tetratricopeptide (TPR) repeat protein
MDQLSAHLDRGWDLVARGDLAGAMLSAQKTLELDGDSPEAHNLLGYIYAQEGNPDEALEHYRHAIAADETYIEAMLNAAEVLIHPLRDLDQAIEMVEDALDYCETPDEVADATLLKFEALLMRGDRTGAGGLLSSLPEGPFENAELTFRIGRARYDLGDVDGAEPLLIDAATRQPGHGDAQYYLGLVREARGDRRGATLAFLSVRELDRREPPPPWSLPPDQFERRVQAAMQELSPPLQERLSGALVVVCDLPGAEVVADGADPRMPMMLEDVRDGRVARVFIYQRNIERAAHGMLEVESEVRACLEIELTAAFPDPAPPA